MSTIGPGLLQFDEVSATKLPNGEVEYVVLVTGISPSTVQLKTMLWAYLSPPVKRLNVVNVEEIEGGPLFKRYKVTARGISPSAPISQQIYGAKTLHDTIAQWRRQSRKGYKPFGGKYGRKRRAVKARKAHGRRPKAPSEPYQTIEPVPRVEEPTQPPIGEPPMYGMSRYPTLHDTVGGWHRRGRRPKGLKPVGVKRRTGRKGRHVKGSRRSRPRT